jgi:hypothetical protein
LPAFWGFVAAISEFFGGVCLILGIVFRPACILLTITMLVAAISHLNRGDGLSGASHAIELGIVFFSLIVIGAGKYSRESIALTKSCAPIKTRATNLNGEIARLTPTLVITNSVHFIPASGVWVSSRTTPDRQGCGKQPQGHLPKTTSAC